MGRAALPLPCGNAGADAGYKRGCLVPLLLRRWGRRPAGTGWGEQAVLTRWERHPGDARRGRPVVTGRKHPRANRGSFCTEVTRCVSSTSAVKHLPTQANKTTEVSLSNVAFINTKANGKSS